MSYVSTERHKSNCCLHSVDVSKCEHFPFTPSGSAYTTNSLAAIEKVMVFTGAGQIIKLMNPRIAVNKRSMYIFSYLDRSAGVLHDSVRKNSLTHFLPPFPSRSYYRPTLLYHRHARSHLCGEQKNRQYTTGLMIITLKGKGFSYCVGFNRLSQADCLQPHKS